ncbi:putative leader peptide [Streptomyces sp. BH055]|uniref:putative leader peptide n=1 Tax=unclassified Streptomyces TaxID=2593676 RepID=UPI003BB7635A
MIHRGHASLDRPCEGAGGRCPLFDPARPVAAGSSTAEVLHVRPVGRHLTGARRAVSITPVHPRPELTRRLHVDLVRVAGACCRLS